MYTLISPMDSVPKFLAQVGLCGGERIPQSGLPCHFLVRTCHASRARCDLGLVVCDRIEQRPGPMSPAWQIGSSFDTKQAQICLCQPSHLMSFMPPHVQDLRQSEFPRRLPRIWYADDANLSTQDAGLEAGSGCPFGSCQWLQWASKDSRCCRLQGIVKHSL